MLGAKGLAGAFRVEPLTDVLERLSPGQELYLEGEVASRRVTASEPRGRRPVIYLEGIEDQAAAAALQGRYLEVETQPLPEGVYYWHQLVGLRVTDEAGTQLGEVVEVFRAGENEVYRVEGPNGELLLPALRQVVRSIDIAAGSMVVRYEEEEVR